MAGKYAVPEEIRKLKPRGTTVKLIHGGYYVFTQKAKKLKSGRWGAATGVSVGKIVPGIGYVPNSDRPYTVLDYGTYRLFDECASETRESFLSAFGPDGIRIWALALIYAVRGFRPMRAIGKLYRRSMLSVRYPGLKLSESAVSNLLDFIGTHTTCEKAFEDGLARKAREVAVDGHVIPRYSKLDGMTRYGYKYRKIQAEQVNLLAAFDIATGSPILMRMFDGNMVDKASVKGFVDGLGVTDCLLLFDRGFHSEELKTAIESKKCSYIMPLSANLLRHKEAMKRERGRLKEFVYSHKEGIRTEKDIVEYSYKDYDGKTRVYMFRNRAMADAEETDYLSKAEAGVAGYTESGLSEARKDFGVIVLETTDLDDAPGEIYRLYKDRWDIETYFDYLKDQMDFNALGISDWAKLQGLSFLMLLSSLIRADVEKRLKDSGLKNTNMPDVVIDSDAVKAVKKGNGWSIENAGPTETGLFDAFKISMGSNIEVYVPAVPKTDGKPEQK